MKKFIKVLMILNLVTMFIISPVSAKTINDGNNHSFSTAKSVGLNDTIKGNLRSDESDFYKITIPSSSSYKVNMDVKIINDYFGMKIYNSTGRLISEYYFDEGDIGFQIYNNNLYFDPGVYYIKMESDYTEKNVNYTVKLKSTKINNIDYKSNTSLSHAISLKMNRKVTAVSSIYNVYSWYGYNDDDFFKFYVSKKRKIKIGISSAHGFHFSLYNSKGKRMDELYKDKSGNLQKTLNKGTYYLGIDITDPETDILNGSWNSFGGKYTITLVAVPSAVNLSSTKSNAKKKLTVKYKKVSGASGYRIYYKKQGSKKWYSKYTTKTSYTLSKLSRKKYYSVKVRAYKTVGGVKHYGAYSKTKKAKVK